MQIFNNIINIIIYNNISDSVASITPNHHKIFSFNRLKKFMKIKNFRYFNRLIVILRKTLFRMKTLLKHCNHVFYLYYVSYM